MKRLRQYLLGRRFIIRTDHQALKWLHNCKDPSSRLIRWRLRLEEYNYEIEYTKGKDNTAADALSRVHAVTRNEIVNLDLLIDHTNSFNEWKNNNENPKLLEIKPNDQTFYQLTRKDLGEYDETLWIREFYKILKNTTKIGIGNNDFTELEKTQIKLMLIYFNDTYKEITYAPNPILKLDESEILQTIKENHNDTVGHLGIQKTYQRIKDKFKIPGLFERVENFVKTCDTGQKEKLTRIRPKESPQVSDTPLHPNDKIAMDIIGPMTKTKRGNQYILSIHDELTKYLILVPLKTQRTESIINALIEHYIYIFSAPKTILTDQGQNFVSDLMTKFEEAFKIKNVKTTSFHPQSNGSLERTHASVKDLIRTALHDNDKEWDEVLNFICLGYNTAKHEGTGFSPLPSAMSIFPTFTYDDMYSLWQKQLNKYWETAHKTLIQNKQRYKRDQERKIVKTQTVFRKGDFVLIHNDHKRDKLDIEWLEPYRINDVKTPYYIISIDNIKKKIHSNRLKTYFFQDNADPSTSNNTLG